MLCTKRTGWILIWEDLHGRQSKKAFFSMGMVIMGMAWVNVSYRYGRFLHVDPFSLSDSERSM